MEPKELPETDPKQNKLDKCKTCYLVDSCMLTPKMTEYCGGPWKDEEERDVFIKKEILGHKIGYKEQRPAQTVYEIVHRKQKRRK
ncbi:MAG: hypothetical protein AABY50_10050 [Nitrospirota bacterium]